MITLDTSGLLAALDAGQDSHAEAKKALRAATPPLLLSPFVLAELDYLIGKYVGPQAAQLFLDEVAKGAYSLVPFDNDTIKDCMSLAAKYAGMHIGIADASVWYMANLYRSHEILTLDERHFRVLTSYDGSPFRLLPADAI